VTAVICLFIVKRKENSKEEKYKIKKNRKKEKEKC